MVTRLGPLRERGLDLIWSTLVPLLAVVLYFGIGIAIVSVVSDPLLGTAALGIGFFIGLVAMRRLKPVWFDYQPQPTVSVRSPRLRWLVLVGVVLAFLAGQTMSLWLLTTIGSEGFERSSQLRADASVMVVLLLTLVAAPMGEEALLRGLVYPVLRKRIPILVSALISSLVFAIMHGNLVQIVATVPLAVLLALVYERTRALWPCVVAHVGFNLAATLIPPQLLLLWANRISAPILLIGFAVCAAMIYQRIRPSQPLLAAPDDRGGVEGEHSDPRAA